MAESNAIGVQIKDHVTLALSAKHIELRDKQFDWISTYIAQIYIESETHSFSQSVDSLLHNSTPRYFSGLLNSFSQWTAQTMASWETHPCS